MTDSPDLSTVLREALDARIAQIAVSIPGVITKVSSGPPVTVDVEIATKVGRVLDDGAQAPTGALVIDDGAQRVLYETGPPLRGCRVGFPGAGDLWISFGLAVGAEVLVEFSDRCIAQWLRLGGSGRDPLDTRRHTLNGPIVRPIRPISDAGSSGQPALATNEIVINVPSGTVVRVGDVSANESATSAEQLQEQINDLRTALTAHTHGGVQTGGGSTGPGPTLPLVSLSACKTPTDKARV